ncbi:MAG TPA: YafY family protein [Ktedonobacterales bacterium]|jgi:predicted DNA-binding transcriptional regulator YafY|nr:YafY family protein [Ktedonobacterales bacterium]
MYHPTTRVLSVLELLQSYAEMSGIALAERLEVDVRTVRRYVTMLQDLGIPVESRRGRYGAYRLRPGYKLPPLMFSSDEAVGVVLGLVVAQRLDIALTAPAIESALAKILRVLPVGLRGRVQALQETLVLDFAERGIPAAGEMLLLLGQAVRQRQRVWLRYRAWESNESERLLDPYGLVYRGNRWYVVGYCHLRQGIRVFRLDRVVAVEAREEPFERPERFDVLEQVERSIGQTPARWHCEVRLTLSLDEARERIPLTVGSLEETANGVLLRCEFERLSWVAHYLLGLDCDFVVLEPPELRDEMLALAARLEAAARSPM